VVDWDEARILEIESDRKCRKCKESVHVACFNKFAQSTQFGDFSHMDPHYQPGYLLREGVADALFLLLNFCFYGSVPGPLMALVVYGHCTAYSSLSFF
jgi:hypothetical protein